MAEITSGRQTTIVLNEWESCLLGIFLAHHTPLGVELGGRSPASIEAIKLTGTPESDEKMKALVGELIERLWVV
jgi:hypothetical protein